VELDTQLHLAGCMKNEGAPNLLLHYFFPHFTIPHIFFD
jgi:hypothetical protein